MSPFTFVHSTQSNEILVGTCMDIATTTGQVADQTFENTEALVQKLQAFRSQEIIITFVSEDDELQRRWNDPYGPPSQRSRL